MAKDIRVPLMMSSEELKAIDDYRFQNRIASRAKTIRRLCSIALDRTSDSKSFDQLKISYRMLATNDLISEEDEFLGDDAITWERIGDNWIVGSPYFRGLKPARRPVTPAPTSKEGE